MDKSPISIARNDTLILALTRGEPLSTALQNAGLTPARALQILGSARARRRFHYFRRLLALQRRLILRSAVPDALAAVLRALRDDQKPELQLKAAQAILQLTRAKPSRRAPEPPPEEPELGINELPPGVTEEEVRAAIKKRADEPYDPRANLFPQ